MKNPWCKFYFSDWRSDPCLRMCGLAARGLWMEILALMHEAEPYGFLTVKGVVPTDVQLAILVGAQPDQVPALLAELETAGVFSRNRAGTIYSRRMTIDEKKAKIARQNGKSGGNPSLSKDRVIPPSDKGGDKGEDKAQIPEARDLESKKEESPPASRVPPKGGDDRGSRLPNDFVVPEEWIIEGDELRASRRLPPADTRTEALGFTLYWSTVPGPKGRKTNWHRTWLNRCLAMKGINHAGKPKHDWHDVAAGVVLDIHGGDRHRDSAEDRGFAGPFLDAGCLPGEPCGDDPGLDRGSAGILSLDNYRRLP